MNDAPLVRYYRSESRKGAGWHFGRVTRSWKTRAGVEMVQIAVIQPPSAKPRKRGKNVTLPVTEVQPA